MPKQVIIRNINGDILGAVPQDSVDAGHVARHIPFPASLAFSNERLDELGMKPDGMILLSVSANEMVGI